MANGIGDLVERLEATGKWWMIGRGKATPDEPLFGCIIQEPSIDGARLAMAEGEDLRACVAAALTAYEADGATRRKGAARL